jgi:hypothetical protein
MKPQEFDEAIKAKTLELEGATALGKSKTELLEIYRELKELQFQKVQSGLNQSISNELV